MLARSRQGMTETLTNLDIPTGVKKNVVRLDITMNNVLTMQMGKAFAGLHKGQPSPKS